MTRQTVTLAVAEDWGFYTADSQIDLANLAELAPSAATARQLIRRAPKHDRPVICRDLTALAERLKRRGAVNRPIAIYRHSPPGTGVKQGWQVFNFSPAN